MCIRDRYQDEEWVQLGAPNTNRAQPGINPAFPAYPSGHATFGTSALSVAKHVLNIPGPKVSLPVTVMQRICFNACLSSVFGRASSIFTKHTGK